MSKLVVEHVSKSFDGVPILEDVSLRLEEGELVCLLGVSGAGKTTLFNIISGLMEPEEVAEAFDILESSGKVRAFGVSNHNPMQIELLNQYCGGKICIDQIQFSAAHCPTIDAGLNVNIHNDAGCNRDGGLIEYARLKKITLQAWSPFQYGMFEGIFIGSEKFPELNRVLDELSEKYDASPNAIATAWILRHPAGIQTIAGSTSLKRIQDICRADDIVPTREEWYRIYLAAGKQLP